MRSFVLALGAVALLSTSACGSVSLYQGPLDRLADGTADTRAAIQTLAEEDNKLTISNRALEAAATSAPFGDPEMKPLISPEHVKARVDGLVMIERFAAQMLRVVKSEESALASKQVMALGTDVDAFSKTLGATTAQAYGAPLGGLATVVIGLYDASKREGILKRATAEGVPAAKSVLLVLLADFKSDSPTSFDVIKLKKLKQLKFEYLAAYTAILTKEKTLPAAQTQSEESARYHARFDAIQKIIETQRLIDQASRDQVYQTLAALDESLDALAAAASHGAANEETMQALVDHLTIFSGNAVALLDSVNAVKSVSSAK